MPYKYLLMLAIYIASFAAFTLISSDASFAQRPRASVENRVKRLTQQLSLSKDQADSVLAIYRAADQERAKLVKDQSGDRGAIRESMGKLMRDADAKVDALLTEKQKAKFDQIKKDRPRRMAPPQEQKMKDAKDRTGQK